MDKLKHNTQSLRDLGLKESKSGILSTQIKKENTEKPTYGISNFIRIANDYMNPDLDTVSGIQKWLIGWYCLQFNTTLKDPRLTEMTVEELLVLHNMHKIKEDSSYVDKMLNTDVRNSYEDWLKEQMGDSYVTDEDMIKTLGTEEKEHQKSVKETMEKLPEKITTDFSQFQEE